MIENYFFFCAACTAYLARLDFNSLTYIFLIFVCFRNRIMSTFIVLDLFQQEIFNQMENKRSSKRTIGIKMVYKFMYNVYLQLV